MRLAAALAVRAAEALEAGAFSGGAARFLEAQWTRRASVERQVELPQGTAVIGVGGPTLGGSYKTPLVLALALALASRGEPVSVVASSYRSRLRGPRRIVPGDSVEEVGDEALWLSRALWHAGVAVVAGGTRAGALELAASSAPRVIVDALLQTRPVPLALSLLAVDGERPWGAGRCPPAGDLRAPVAHLLGATDRVVPIAGDERHAGQPVRASQASVPEAHVTSRVSVADAASGSFIVDLATLRAERVGLVTAIARPERVLASLARAGVRPIVVRRFADHHAPTERSRAEGRAAPSLWLTTPKCATKMAGSFEGAGLLVLRHELVLPEALVLAAAAASAHRRA